MTRKPVKQSYPGRVKIREKVMKSGGRSLYLDMWYGGKRTYEFLSLYLTGNKQDDTETRRLAESIRAKREMELQTGRHGLTPSQNRKANFLDYFAKLAEAKGGGNWTYAQKHLEAFAKGGLPFELITEAKLEELKTFLLSRLSRGTAHTYFTVVRTALAQALRDRIVAENPAVRVEIIGSPESDRVHLSIDEVRRLSETPCPNDHVKRGFLFACFCGLRRSDVRAIRWGDIDGEMLRYRPFKTRHSRDNIEWLPLSAQALELAGERGEDTEPVFQLGTDSGIRYALLKWVQTAGISKNVGFHTARHTFATLALTNGVDIYTVQKLLAHKNIAVTQIYAKVVDSKKREAVNLIPSLRGDSHG